MAAANGSAEADIINFNFPDQTEAGRTITILTELPLVSANLTIDGSSQPGAVFGISTAKVKILTGFDFGRLANVLLLEDIHDVNIYGLYIKNELVCPNGVDCYYWQGIAIRNCRNIEIGAAGKGNVILGFEYDIGMNVHTEGGQISFYCVNVNVKGNYIGTEPDGKTLSAVRARILRMNYIIEKLNIGGTPAEGNLIANGIEIAQENSHDYTGEGVEMLVTPATIVFRNNKVGVDYSETIAFPASAGFALVTHSPNGKNTAFIEDNIISSSGYAIRLNNIGAEVNIRRNYIGIDRSLSKELPIGDTGIFVYWCTQVKVGSLNPADKNFIANCKPVNVWPFSSVSVNKNSFFCVKNMSPMIFVTDGTYPFPFVKISNITGNTVSGTASPNSEIELFYADKCGTCAPETYFGSAKADAAGNWMYNGPLQGTVIASATLNGATSEFTGTEIDLSKVIVENTCPLFGSIRGLVPAGFTDLSWIDENGKIVGTMPDLLDVPPGRYKLKIGNGDCAAESPWYEIKQGLSIEAPDIKIIDASCNKENGSVKGIKITNHTASIPRYSWKDADGKEIGTALDLINAGPGTYLLTVSLGDGSCTLPYGPVMIKNTSGPEINKGKAVVTAATCDQANGSITGMTAAGAGKLSYEWKNESGALVGTSLDLLDQPTGSYTLGVLDESACGLVLLTAIQIPAASAIILNDNGIVKPASCDKSNGAIQGILVSGATSYRWFDAADKLIATTSTANLMNIPGGIYYLVASNLNCTKISKKYFVKIETSMTVDDERVKIVHDRCNLNVGSIRGPDAGGLAPVTFKWTNEKGAVLGTQRDLINLGEGIYHVTITDGAGCSTVLTYQLLNLNETAQRPSIDDVQLCGGGDALLVVNNASAEYGYKLYDDEQSLIPLDEQPSGRFKIAVKDNRSFYISEYRGACESLRTKVNVSIGFPEIEIPSAFSPNNDGKNDTWEFKGKGDYTRVGVIIFNRHGEKVFETASYQVPFDGKRNGSNLPAGVYFYVIKMGDGCNTISGSLTLLR